jgi:uncharacterized protein
MKAPHDWPVALRWVALLLVSALIAPLLEALRLPAALLLGPMAASILLAGLRAAPPVPPVLFVAAQAVVGCLVAAFLPPSLLPEIGQRWPVFAAGVTAVVAAAAGLGAVLARWRVLPGTTAVWGAMPGAATVMVLLSDGFGADMRLVAVMQYLRVVCVAAVASVVARVSISGGGVATMPHWFAPVPLVPFAETVLLATAGAMIGQVSRLPAGALLLPMVAGMVLKGVGLLSITLPLPLLGAAYAVVGWSIGARFTGETLRYAARALPRVLGAIAALIALCGLFAVLLHRLAGVDPLTAYLATSPGGADSVAIIASSSKVDVPFVMAMQVSRFMLVLLIGPTVARLVARAVSRAGATAREPTPADRSARRDRHGGRD